MINDIKELRMNKHLNIYMINSKKFKTDLLGIFIKRPLNKLEVAKNALISRLLLRSTNNYKTTKDLNMYLEESYGMILVSDVIKYGESHVMQFKLQFPNKKHILNGNIFNEALDLLKEVLLNPDIENRMFNDEYFKQEKNNLISEIESRKDDKISYSFERCIENMYEDEKYSIYNYGIIDDVEAITNKDLYEYYLEIMQTSLFEVCIIGDVEFDIIEEGIKNAFKTQNKETVKYNKVNIHKDIKDIKYVTEKFDVKQCKLVMGYRTNINHNHRLHEASVIAYHILSGGPNSKLFQVIREEKNLCYYISAKIDKFQGCLLIGAGIDNEDYDAVLETTKEEINKLKNNEFTEEILEITKDAMVSSIRSLSDFSNSFINFYYTEILSRDDKNLKFNLDELCKKYEAVTSEEVIEALNLLELDTVYFIEGNGELDE